MQKKLVAVHSGTEETLLQNYDYFSSAVEILRGQLQSLMKVSRELLIQTISGTDNQRKFIKLR